MRRVKVEYEASNANEAQVSSFEVVMSNNKYIDLIENNAPELVKELETIAAWKTNANGYAEKVTLLRIDNHPVGIQTGKVY